MWAQLQKHLDLEPPTKADGGIYLGCGQYNLKPEDIPNFKELVAEKQKLFAPILKETNNKTASQTKDESKELAAASAPRFLSFSCQFNSSQVVWPRRRVNGLHEFEFRRLITHKPFESTHKSSGS